MPISLISSFCTSGQMFAASFLQIPTHDGHPCSWLYTSRYRACYGLAPLRECSCWANTKKDRHLTMPVFMVEIVGVEPTTLCLQSRCSSQLSYTPVFSFLLSDNCVRLLILPPHNHKVAASVGARLPCSRLKINFKISKIALMRILRQTSHSPSSQP